MPRTSLSVQLDGDRLDVSTTFKRLRIRASTVDHKGRTSGSSVEIDNLGTKARVHNPGPKLIESSEYSRSEGGYPSINGGPQRYYSQTTKDGGALRVEAQPPSSDEFGDILHKSPDYRPPSPTHSSGRMAARGTAAASTVCSSSYRSGVSNSSHHRPRRESTSRSSTGPAYDIPHTPRPFQDMGGSEARYNSRNASHASESGHTEGLRSHARSYPLHLSNTSPDPRHRESWDPHRSADSRSFSDSERIQSAPSSSADAYRREMVLYRSGHTHVPNSYPSRASRGSYQQSPRHQNSTYDVEDHDGGVSLQDDDFSSSQDDFS